MFSLPKKYIYIIIIILILIISAVILLCGHNKLTSSRDSLSFKATNTPIPEKLAAAILLLTPTTGQFYIGDTISVALLVSVSDQSINVIEGKITFPSDKLEVISISKEDSIITLWAQEPVVSSSQSFIAFSGGLPSPGFIGTAGQVMTISFKVKNGGDAVIDLEGAHVLANDGFGTDILAETTPIHLTLLKPKIKKVTADLNEDGKINLIDVSILLTNWGTSKSPKADLNGDGIVDAKDLSTLLSKWSH